MRKCVIFGFICHDIFEFQIKNEIENEVENQPKMATVNDPNVDGREEKGHTVNRSEQEAAIAKQSRA